MPVSDAPNFPETLHPCTCREDVVCGACMSGAADPSPAAATPETATPPADDVREALADEITGIAVRGGFYGTTLDNRAAREAADLILAAFEVRPRGTVTDAEVWPIQDALIKPFHGLSYRERQIVRAALEAARAVQS